MRQPGKSVNPPSGKNGHMPYHPRSDRAFTLREGESIGRESRDSIYAIIEAVDPQRMVVDTNVIVSAIRSHAGTNRAVLRLCLQERVRPVVGQALFLEYEDVLSREALFKSSPLTSMERRERCHAFLSVCE